MIDVWWSDGNTKKYIWSPTSRDNVIDRVIHTDRETSDHPLLVSLHNTPIDRRRIDSVDGSMIEYISRSMSALKMLDTPLLQLAIASSIENHIRIHETKTSGCSLIYTHLDFLIFNPVMD